TVPAKQPCPTTHDQPIIPGRGLQCIQHHGTPKPTLELQTGGQTVVTDFISTTTVTTRGEHRDTTPTTDHQRRQGIAHAAYQER
ncbi:MAG: hypothetical protein QGH82_06840, partial [Candidatus Woesearchaeota archaeon]|nr:hypothetical protein [Candidatus Woesearchaeota archaeon]